MSDTQYDVVVIGAGPGGYVAAIRAAQLGLKTAVVERQYWGGVCLNIGCIPAKALLHTADLLEEARDGKRFGVVAQQVSLDWGAAMANKDRVVKVSTQGVSFLMKKHKIDTFNGTGRLTGRGAIQVTGEDGKQTSLVAKNTIIATGAKPRDLPQIGAAFDEDRILSSTGALVLKEVPKSLLIVGAGAIGCEFASMYRAFGSEVTLVEMLPRIVPIEDEEISAELGRAFSKRGIKIMTGAKLGGVDRGESQVVATITDSSGKEQKIAAERMLVGIGWQASNNKGIGLEELGVATDERGFIQVNSMMQTNVDGVYAIGDCTVKTPWLAHKASAEALVAAEHIAGHHPPAIDYEKVPGCTYCSPEIGSIGLTEAKARERGYDVKIGKFPFSANGKARILDARVGFVKVVADKQYDEVLGIHIIGPHATELIAEGGVALSHEATAESLMRTIHAHPTLYEALGEAEHAAAEGEAIHI
ncbi:MAG: dihydrolipoyl dehydrogenase [Roseiflexaceae bacterium]